MSDQDMLQQVTIAASKITKGMVIAYPTEAVYGLGCDVENHAAITKICNLKNRKISQGLIIVAAHWELVKHYTKPIEKERYKEIFTSWPGHTTWVFPASSLAPHGITGEHKSIAIRISAHPVIQALSLQLNAAIVSTSANIHGCQPAISAREVKQQFPNLDYIIDAEVGSKKNTVSIIKQATNGKILRP